MDTAIERKTKEKIDSSYILLSQVKNRYSQKISATNYFIIACIHNLCNMFTGRIYRAQDLHNSMQE